jgi:hypothetical protein
MTGTSLDDRVSKLEKQLGFWKLSTVCLAVLSLSAVLVSHARAKPLRIDATAVVANEFDLANPHGRIVARLALDPAEPDNAPMLVFKYPNNNAAAMIGVSGSGPFVSLFATNGDTRASLDEEPQGPHLALLDEDAKLRVLVDAENQKPEIVIYGESIKQKLWVAPVSNSK